MLQVLWLRETERKTIPRIKDNKTGKRYQVFKTKSRMERKILEAVKLYTGGCQVGFLESRCRVYYFLFQDKQKRIYLIKNYIAVSLVQPDRDVFFPNTYKTITPYKITPLSRRERKGKKRILPLNADYMGIVVSLPL